MMNEDLENGSMKNIDLDEPYVEVHDLCGPRRKLLFGGAGVFVLVIIVIIAVAVSGKNREDTPPVPYAQVPEEHQELHDMVTTALDDQGVPTNEFLRENGHQYKAFNWLTTNSKLDDYDRTVKLQRYTLAAFYYATYDVGHEYSDKPGPWINKNRWLSDETECKWHGIDCDENGKVHSIVLEDNNLSGSLPLDLALVRDPLRVLDITSNKVYMEGKMFDLFIHVHRVKHLNIDDNFMVSDDGLPTTLKALTNLEQFKASYNLLSGKLDNGVLPELTKLTHLEVESNFLTGSLLFLEDMSSLVYVYLRDNDLRAHLHFLKKGKLTNLFSLWLDRNDISESIPTQVKHLSSLQSFSVTNSSLTGTIPTEFGHLSNLNRLWLYGNELKGTVPQELEKLSGLEVLEVQDNKLTGTMPKGVCMAVAGSDYEDKALVADCAEVTCNDCCTRCA